MLDDRPVVICNRPNDVVESVRWGEKVIPETLETPGT
jgi:hypothetical protein